MDRVAMFFDRVVADRELGDRVARLANGDKQETLKLIVEIAQSEGFNITEKDYCDFFKEV